MRKPLAIQITTVCTLLALIGGAYAWDLGQRDDQHSLMASDYHSESLESELQRIEIELKMYNYIQDDRVLDRSEQARYDYLIQRRLQINARLMG